MRLEMFEAAERLDFETAARLRDELRRLGPGGDGASNDTAPRSETKAYEPYAKKNGRTGRAKAGAPRTASGARSSRGPQGQAVPGPATKAASAKKRAGRK
jgi:hypothetical protein